jgi:probable poly-beta-1,6-N-acetyl-D-glucosamine export protein
MSLFIQKCYAYFMKTNPEYFFEIVYLRALAILAVISIHVSGSFDKMSSINFLTLLYMSISTFSHFAVPLFVCISGFVLYNKYQGTFSLKVFYKKRLMSVIPQYTIFSILWILFIYIGTIYLGKVWNFSAIDLIYQYLTGTAFYHLWFFILIIQLYILYPIFEKIFTKSVEKNKTFHLLIFLLIVEILYQIFSDKNIQYSGNLTIFLGYIFYFVLGFYVRSNYLNYKKIEAHMPSGYMFIFFLVLLPVTILGIVILSTEYFRNSLNSQIILIFNVVSAIITPFYYILIFVLCLYFALKILEMIPNMTTKSLQIIGNYSFGIYLIHAFILYFLTVILLPKLGFTMNDWLYYPVVMMLVLSMSLTLVYIINKFPYHEYIIGSSR